MVTQPTTASASTTPAPPIPQVGQSVPAGTKYTPAMLLSLAAGTIERRVVKKTAGGEGVGTTIELVDPDKSSDPSLNTTISLAEFEARIVQAAAIMWAESGGDPFAVCYNFNDPTKVTATNPTGASCSRTPLPAGTPGVERGYDRGLWQFNSVFYGPTSKPWAVTDMAAYEPGTATEIAYRVSRGFTAFSPWSKSHGADHKHPKYLEVAAVWESMTGRAVEEIPFTGINVSTVSNVFGPLLSWTEGLGKLLSTLVSPQFWIRVGTALAGVVLLVLAVVYLARSTAVGTVSKALKGKS